MANICSNALKITGKTEDLNKLLDKICVERNPNMVVTGGCRTNVSGMELFKKYEANPEYKNVRMTEENGYTVITYEEKAGYDNFGGAVEGTNIYIDGIELDLLASGELNLSYATNWEPLDVVDKLAQLYPELTFTHYYAEPGNGVYGYVEYESGECINSDSPHLVNVTIEEWLLHHAPEDFNTELGLLGLTYDED